MTRIAKLAALALIASAAAGCAAQPGHPVEFTGQQYSKICNHPSMTAAAYREAFACHRSEAHAVARKDDARALVAVADATDAN